MDVRTHNIFPSVPKGSRRRPIHPGSPKELVPPDFLQHSMNHIDSRSPTGYFLHLREGNSVLFSPMNRTVGLLRKAPVRTFILSPVVVLAWETWLNGDQVQVQPPYLFLMLWGYLQFRLCGIYRTQYGGGGPGMDVPPEQLVTSGPYTLIRNPMYLGHVIFLVGLSLTVSSLLAALIAAGTLFRFHSATLRDERRMVQRFGQDYLEYMARVKRWIPGLF